MPLYGAGSHQFLLKFAAPQPQIEQIELVMNKREKSFREKEFTTGCESDRKKYAIHYAVTALFLCRKKTPQRRRLATPFFRRAS